LDAKRQAMLSRASLSTDTRSMDRFPKPIDAQPPKPPSTAHYVVWVTLIILGWIYLWAAALINAAETGCVNELQAVLMLIVAPVLQVAVLITSALVRTRRWSVLWWGTLAALALWLIAYASTTSGAYC
jgi:hypothetical protein